MMSKKMTFAALFTAEIGIDTLGKSLYARDSQRLYLIDRPGQYITNPDKAMMMGGDFFAEHGLESHKAAALASRSFSAETKDVLFYSALIPEAGWIPVSVIPRSVIFAGVNHFLCPGVAGCLLTSIDTLTQSIAEALNRFQSIDREARIVSEQEAGIRSSMEAQRQGITLILEAIKELRAITDMVKRESSEIAEESREIGAKSALERISVEVFHGIDETAAGAGEINSAVVRVNEISGTNRDSITTLSNEIAKFKVAETPEPARAGSGKPVKAPPEHTDG